MLAYPGFINIPSLVSLVSSHPDRQFLVAVKRDVLRKSREGFNDVDGLGDFLENSSVCCMLHPLQ